MTIQRPGGKLLTLPADIGLRVIQPRAAAALWAPTDLPGLVLWLDADAIAGLSDGDPVGTWSDQSGESNDFTQATTARKPTYKTSIQNGLPIVRFDGGDFLAEAGGAVSLRVTTFSVFIVFYGVRPYVGSFGGLAYHVCEDATGRILHEEIPSKRVLSQFYDSGAGYHSELTDSAYNFDEWHIFEATLTTGASNWKFYKSGAANGTATGFIARTGTTPMEVGRGHTSYPFTGDIAEFILYNSALSDADRGLVEAYLGTKWGIALP